MVFFLTVMFSLHLKLINNVSSCSSFGINYFMTVLISQMEYDINVYPTSYLEWEGRKKVEGEGEGRGRGERQRERGGGGRRGEGERERER